MSTTRKAIEYLIRSGGVPMSVFVEDFAPIGRELLDELLRFKYAEVNLAARLVATNKGVSVAKWEELT